MRVKKNNIIFLLFHLFFNFFEYLYLVNFSILIQFFPLPVICCLFLCALLIYEANLLRELIHCTALDWLRLAFYPLYSLLAPFVLLAISCHVSATWDSNRKQRNRANRNSSSNWSKNLQGKFRWLQREKGEREGKVSQLPGSGPKEEAGK